MLFQIHSDDSGLIPIFAIGVICVGIAGSLIYAQTKENRLRRKQDAEEEARKAAMSAEEREADELALAAAKTEAEAKLAFGLLNAVMVCPHCQTKGQIRTMHIDKKQGISGGKATAAVLTGGLSVIATGLSRVEGITQAHCDACNNTWTF